MWPNPHETADLVTFTEETLMENFIFCAVIGYDNDIITLLAHSTSLLVISSALGELTMPLLVGQVSDIQEQSNGKFPLWEDFSVEI